MMKWLRAHTKKIMVGVVLLAMLAFLGSEAMFSLLSPQDKSVPVARAFGREITNFDLLPAQSDITALDALGAQWRYDADGRMNVEHWYVLLMEAERAGVVVSDAEVEDEINAVQQSLTQRGVTQSLFDLLRTQKDITPPALRRAVRNHIMIRKHAGNVHMASVPSEPEVRHWVRDTEDKVKVRIATLDAQLFFKDTIPVTAEELAEQFEKNKDYLAADSPTGYGYKYPRRVKLQYVVAHLNTLSGQMTPSLDELTAYWKSNRAKYQKVTYEVPPIATTQPEGQPPPEPKRVTVEKTFSEARPDVERDVKTRNAQQTAEQALRKIASLLGRPWQGVRTDAQTGYKPIPAGVDAPDFMKNIVAQVERELNIKLTYVETPLMTAEEIRQDADLRSFTMAGEGPSGLAIRDYAFRVPPFYKHEAGADMGLSLQFFQPPDAPLTANTFAFADGKFVPAVERVGLFRVIEAKDAEVPAALNDVRTQVERDVQMQKAFDEMEPIAQELYAASLRIGLQAAASHFPDKLTPGSVTDKPTIDAGPFARMTRIDQQRMMTALREGKPMLEPWNVVGVGSSQEFIDAVFAMTQEGWRPVPATATDGPGLAAAATQPALLPEPKITVVSVPRLKKKFVVELLEHTPVDETRYETDLRQTGYFALLSSRAAAMRWLWFDLKHIEARSGFSRIAEEPTSPSADGLAPQPAKAAMP